MGEIRPKRCEGRELTKDQLAAPHSCPDDAPTCVGYEYNVSWGHCEVCQCHSNNSLPVFTPWVVKDGATPTAAGFTTSKPLPESWIGKKATRAIEMAWPIVSDDDLFSILSRCI